jgi:hypothetical protein
VTWMDVLVGLVLLVSRRSGLARRVGPERPHARRAGQAAAASGASRP